MLRYTEYSKTRRIAANLSYESKGIEPVHRRDEDLAFDISTMVLQRFYSFRRYSIIFPYSFGHVDVLRLFLQERINF
jgi:hypothetical protein